MLHERSQTQSNAILYDSTSLKPWNKQTQSTEMDIRAVRTWEREEWGEHPPGWWRRSISWWGSGCIVYTSVFSQHLWTTLTVLSGIWVVTLGVSTCAWHIAQHKMFINCCGFWFPILVILSLHAPFTTFLLDTPICPSFLFWFVIFYFSSAMNLDFSQHYFSPKCRLRQ